jgi:hypothetical protein
MNISSEQFLPGEHAIPGRMSSSHPTTRPTHVSHAAVA